MRTTPIAALLLAAGALTACTGQDTPPAPAATVTVTAPPTPTPPPATTPPPQRTTFDLGQDWNWQSTTDDGTTTTGTTTVLAYKQPVPNVSPPGDDGQDGDVWGSVEAKVCTGKNSPGSITVDQFAWSLAFPDGARIEVTGLNGGDFPRPEFPMDATVRAGDCARGLIMFPVPRDQRPERVIYAPDGIEEPIEWTVPAKP